MLKTRIPSTGFIQKTTRAILKRDFVRTVFLVFFSILMLQLWLFARWALGLSQTYVPRPDAVAGIIPIGASLSLVTWLRTGTWDTVAPAGQVILLAALVMSILLKRGFCGWICPVGAFFQIPANFGRRLRKNRDLPVNKWVDLSLRGLRDFLAIGFIFFIVSFMSAQAGLQFLASPFYAVADIKIVQYFVQPPLWWLLTLLVFIGLSVAYGNVWCRWLCPLGGLYSLLSILSLSSIVRNKKTCIDCGKCARVCPNRIPVDRLLVVRDTECDGCQTCVLACPVAGALNARVVDQKVTARWVWPALAVGLWLGIYALALLTGNWHSSMPVEYFREAIQAIGL